MKNKGLVFLVWGLALGLCLGAALLFSVLWLKQAALNVGPGMGKIAAPSPDFTLPDLDGNLLRLSDLRGRVVLLNFWASWCGPCVYEMPLFEAYAGRYPDDLVVLGVNMQEGRSQVGDFIYEMGITYPVLLDEDGAVSNTFRVSALPDTYFIDREGIIRQRHIGSLSQERLDEILVELGVGE